MFRVALSISVLIASLLPVAQVLGQPFVGARRFFSVIGPFGTAALFLFIKYFLVASILFLLFRAIRLDQRFNLHGRGSTQLQISNWVIISYAIILLLARMVEGGGLWYAVGQLQPLILWPCLAIIVWGLFLIGGTMGDISAPENSPDRARVER